MLLSLLLGGTDMARAVDDDGPRAIMEKHGLLGTWAYDCGRRASPNNLYAVWRALDERRVQRDVMDGPTRRIGVGLVESAIELGPNDVEITSVNRYENIEEEVRDVIKLRLDGKRRRTIEHVSNGKTLTTEGRNLKLKANGSESGKPTDWLYKCE